MIIPHRTAGSATQPDPGKIDPGRDQAGKPTPERIAEILLLAQILAAYGRYLAAVIQYRGLWRGFATVAQFFGTAAIADIAVRIRRGIMRAAALEHVLRQRAQRGPDLKILAPRVHAGRASRADEAPTTVFTLWSAGPLPEEWADLPVQLPPDDALPDDALSDETPLASQPGPPCRVTRVVYGPPLTLDTLPSMKQLEDEVRRRPIGRTIAAICLDLGISPTLCAGPFWNRLFEAIQNYHGSLARVVGTMRERARQFEKEDWKHSDLPWPERTREGVRRVLGFFIGEPPVDPFVPAASAYAAPTVPATGPP